jgi:hypothetical protein
MHIAVITHINYLSRRKHTSWKWQGRYNKIIRAENNQDDQLQPRKRLELLPDLKSSTHEDHMKC